MHLMIRSYSLSAANVLLLRFELDNFFITVLCTVVFRLKEQIMCYGRIYTAPLTVKGIYWIFISYRVGIRKRLTDF